MIRRGVSEGVKVSLNNPSIELEAEKEVIVLLADFPKKVEEAGRTYSPAVIANYVFDLCKEFNRYYAKVPLFKDEGKEFLSARLAFCETVAKVIKTSMNLLGVEVPERM